MSTFPIGALIRNREAPEDGPGRVIGEGEGGTIKVVFENTEDVRDITVAHTDIVRLPLIKGMLVEVTRGDKKKHGEIVEVDWPETPRDLCVYIVDCDGTEDTVFESHVTPLTPQSTDPIEQFEKMHWRGPFRFFTRWDMHRMVSRWYEDSEGLPTLIGARIDPSPAPVYGARQVLCDDRTRHLICHDDPVARRYSASMVVESLLSEDPSRRVLVVSPGSLSREWQWELEARFGGHDFVRVDSTHLDRAAQERWSEILERDRVVLSGSTLERFADVCPEVIIDGDWDVVVIDDLASLRDSLYAWGCIRNVAETAARFIGLCPMPRTWRVDDVFSLVELVRPGWAGPEEFEAHADARSDIWGGIDQGRSLLHEDGLDEDGLEEDDFDADAFRALFDGAFDDDYGQERLDQVESTSDAEDLLAYARQFHGLEPAVIRVARDQVVDEDLSRAVSVLEYEPDEAESEIAEAIEQLDAGDDDRMGAMKALYRLSLASSPGRFFGLIEQRLDALEGNPTGEFQTSPVTLLAADPDIDEEQAIWDEVLERAPAMDGEAEWIASTMSLAGQWHAESGEACARFVDAIEWIESFLEETPEVDDDDEAAPSRKVLVCCRSYATVEDFAMYARLKLGDEAVETAGGPMIAEQIDESCGLFRSDPDTRVLVVDESGSRGRDISRADGLLHLELPTSALRLERRMARVDAPSRDPDKPVHIALMQGPGAFDRRCAAFFDALGVPDTSLRTAEFEGAVLDRDFFEVLTDGAELDDLVERAEQLQSSELDERDSAYQAVIRLTESELEEARDFTDLLDFVDGVNDALPIRHWARMLGINDHGSGGGVFDFKWHWNNMRRGLRGYDSPSGDLEMDLLSPEKRVGLHTGTFSRRRALRNESLDFFAPGNRFLDALVEDALGPTDGRATAFARRLGPDGRGKTFLVVVARAHPNEEEWGDLEMPKGLLSRAYRHLWPETVSAIVEIDLGARREPRVVEDFDLIQRVEESYQGPEADQKLEYEMMAKAIGDASRFRAVLKNAVNIGLDHMRDQRRMLVDAAAQELADMLEGELAYLERLEESELPGAESASQRRAWREALIDSVENEGMTLDSLAFIVGGTPETLIS